MPLIFSETVRSYNSITMPSYPSSKTSFTLPTGESGKRESQKQSMKSFVCLSLWSPRLFPSPPPHVLACPRLRGRVLFCVVRAYHCAPGVCSCPHLPFFFNLGLTVPPFLWFQQELLRRRSHPEPKNNLIKYLKEELREGKKTKQSLFSGRPYGMRGTLEAQLSQH